MCSEPGLASLLLASFLLIACGDAQELAAQDAGGTRPVAARPGPVAVTAAAPEAGLRTGRLRAPDPAPVRPRSDAPAVPPDTRATLRWATFAALTATGTLGTLVAVNRPTMLDAGRCEDGEPLLGDYGCDELSTVHGITAGAATVVYTASEVLEVISGEDDRHPVPTWTHRLGIALLPLAGILSRYPEVVGIRDRGTQGEFGEVLRTLHAGVGYLTVLAYSATF